MHLKYTGSGYYDTTGGNWFRNKYKLTDLSREKCDAQSFRLCI